jgi:aminopeptidase N
MKAAAVSAFAAMLAVAAPASAEKGKPELTDQTKRAGGKMIAEQAALQFDRADLAIEVFPDREQISGVATHSFTARSPVRRVVIDLDRNLPVSAVSIDGRPLQVRGWANPEGRLSITLPRAIPKGRSFAVQIHYGGTPRVAVRAPWDGGFVWATTASGKPWIATAVQGEGCDLFWPCIDHPLGEPAVMDIRITVPAGLAAPSNGVLQSITPQADGRSTYHWRVKNPNTYGIALNVGPYKLMKSSYRSQYGNIIPIEWWHLEGHEKQAAGLAEEFAPTLDFFETLIGPYPFGDEKVGIVETPHLGMEHQTINAYGNEYKKAATGYDWLFHHEFAHEWFANQLTASDWDDFWLHEGFGAYMQPLYSRWRGGEFAYHTAMSTARNTIQNKAPLDIGQAESSRGRVSGGTRRPGRRHLREGRLDASHAARAYRRQGLLRGHSPPRLRPARSAARQLQAALCRQRRVPPHRQRGDRPRLWLVLRRLPQRSGRAGAGQDARARPSSCAGRRLGTSPSPCPSRSRWTGGSRPSP